MKKKTILIAAIIAIAAVLFFMRGGITGYLGHSVSYEDLCESDADCREGKTCCVIHEGYGLCDYEDYCQSIEFLCKDDSDCETGTVCCISEGMIHGICNYEDKCMSIEMFSDYVGKVKPKLEKTTQLSPQSTIIGTVAVIALIAVILWLLWKNNQLKKKVKK